MAIFQIKVSYVSKNQSKGKTGGSSKNLSYISRGTSGSGRAKKSLSYISRADEYKDKDDLVHYEEKNVPKEFEDGKDFVDTMEKNSRSNARLLKKYEMSLPLEFLDKENVQIARDFCEQKFGKDYPYFLAVHNPKGEHPHMHLSLSERKLDGIPREREDYFKRANPKNPEIGGLQVNREFSKSEYFDKFCKDWETHLNKHLISKGYEPLKPKQAKEKGEKQERYTKASIEKMSIQDVEKNLLDIEGKIQNNKNKIQKLYRKNIEREALNDLAGDKLYKLENKIKHCEMAKKNSNFTTQKRAEFLRQGKALKEEREKIVGWYKDTSEFNKKCDEKERIRKAELKKLNNENRRLEKNSQKIIQNRSSDDMQKIKDNLRFIKSKNLKKNVRVKNQKNKIQKNKNIYTAGEKKLISKKYQGTLSKTIQVMNVLKKINVLKNFSQGEQNSATQISNMKVSKKYERLKKGGIIFDSVPEKNISHEKNEEQIQEHDKGKVRIRTR